MINGKEDKKLVVALDVGTSKIVVIVAELQEDGVLKIIGLGQHLSKGLKKGVVINIDSTMQAIQRAVEEAELMADCKIKDVYTGIAGSHIKSLNSHGMVKVRDSEVSQMDIDRVLETAQAITLPPDQQVLHVLTQEYVLDDQRDIKEPLGMSGMRLEVKVHIVSGAIAAAQNIIKCIKRCGLEVLELVLQPLASSEAVLTKDEKDLGVCLVDIGGGTTDIAIIKNGSIQHTTVIPIAGDQITNDIAVAFRTPLQSAEDIKINHGAATTLMASTNEIIEIPLVDGREPKKITTQALAQVIEPRVTELFELVRNELQRSRMGNVIASGVVITGGSSMMKGIVNLGEKVFNMPVRIGIPRDVDGLLQVVENPRYATGIGLLKMAKDEIDSGQNHWPDGNSVVDLFKKMKMWFQGNF
ncbi:MAG: cell division protein FtsA [Proteobacteria bacterium]|jgi:cell division protein FtsA|nr:cell division protein FtsA [Pseudomonadota bacterium]MDA0872556.1 cell division protein FtsA [Pseudomonadota bacterium]MDA1133609.1 cell division protein FtsA [Pseudomonadota bacterium]